MKSVYKEAFMDMTCRFGETSQSTRLKVGAMLMKDGNPIACGVNGTRAGWHTNVCEDSEGNTTPSVRHAEIAALDKLRRSSETSVGATLFVSHSCCLPCAVEVVEAGIAHVIFKDLFRDDAGITYLASKGVTVEKIGDWIIVDGHKRPCTAA